MEKNPALLALEPLVGRWRMELHHAAFLPEPDASVSGSVSIEWICDGAALSIRQGISGESPTASWIIGRDDGESDYSVLYADDRGVSRIYRMTLSRENWRMWRETADFSQRFTAKIEANGKLVRGRWEKSVDGSTWEHDFNIDYIRDE
jgi:hypothetical protein